MPTDTFCCFCSGPFENARDTWISFLIDGKRRRTASWPPKDGEWRNPPGYPVPNKPIDEIVAIDEEDGAFWDDLVVVSPVWANKDWVSSRGIPGHFGVIKIDGNTGWNRPDEELFLRIHRFCLSFVTRRLSISPQGLWESLYSPDAEYPKYNERDDGLLYQVDYYDMEGRCGHLFQYAMETFAIPESDGPEETRFRIGYDAAWLETSEADYPLDYEEIEGINGLVYRFPYDDKGGRRRKYIVEGGFEPEPIPMAWLDPSTMNDAVWLLSRPNKLPHPKPLRSSSIAFPTTASLSSLPRVFQLQELLDIILPELVSIADEVIVRELERDRSVFDPPSLIKAARVLLSLAQVDRWFYSTIIHQRQGLFLRLASSFGWMLPCTAADWSLWPAEFTPLTFRLNQPYDWREYFLAFVRKEDRYIRNRWRLHKMAVQFARNCEGNAGFRWQVGQVGVPSDRMKPVAKHWEEA